MYANHRSVVVGLRFSTVNAFAQDPFANVTNAPRTSEFVHWDAGAFGGFKSELEEQHLAMFTVPSICILLASSSCCETEVCWCGSGVALRGGK